MSLLFNMLSRLVITFLLRSKCLFNFMAAVIICSDFGAQENAVCHCFHCFPIYLPWSKWWDQMPWSSFFECWVLSQIFTFLFHLHQEALQFLFTFCHKMIYSAYLRLLVFPLAILIPACASSSPAFHMIYFSYKLNKQGDNIQSWHISWI